MIISSRTPEGRPNCCSVCGATIRIEPSMLISDAPCPTCGNLLWFPPNEITVVRDISAADIDAILHVAANKLPQRLLLNFEGVAFMSSAIIGKLIRLNLTIKKHGGKLTLCNVSPDVLEILRITQLNILFDIVGDEDQGLDALT